MRCPSADVNGKPSASGVRVGLEVAVDPVAVVLELQQVALQRDDRLHAIDHLDGHLRVRREHARERAVLDALGVDVAAAARRAAHPRSVCARYGRPTDAVERVVDVEADLAVLEHAPADAVHLVADDAVGRARDGARPVERDRLVAMATRVNVTRNESGPAATTQSAVAAGIVFQGASRSAT